MGYLSLSVTRQLSAFKNFFLKRVPNFDLQLLADTLKKGTKFRLLFGGGETRTERLK